MWLTESGYKAAGLAPKSFCSDLIEVVDRGELTDVQAAWLCGLILYVQGYALLLHNIANR